MDAWALFASRAFGLPPTDYCLVGRWLGHMPAGRFAHASIGDAPTVPGECAIGWCFHYFTGVVYALAFVALVSPRWLAQPTLVAPLAFGIASVAVPILIMQPAFGLGIAASKAPRPVQARVRSLMAHTSFGVGLYLSAVGMRYIFEVPG